MFRFGLLLALGVFVLDQASKLYVLGSLGLSPEGCLAQSPAPPLGACGRLELSSVVDLTMVWNFGVSFGMLQAGHDLARWGLVALSGAISVFFLFWLKDAGRRMTAVSLGLVVGGALGNMIDRIRFGAVADFIDFGGPWFGWRIGAWPVGFPWVFNVADAAITVGAAILFVDFLLHGEDKAKPAAAG